MMEDTIQPRKVKHKSHTTKIVCKRTKIWKTEQAKWNDMQSYEYFLKRK